jgi:hypothetical protein
MGAFLAVPVAAALQVVVAHALGMDDDAKVGPQPHPTGARAGQRVRPPLPEPALTEAAASAPETR